MDQASNIYFILLFITFILDIILFPIIVLILCFKQVPLKAIFSCKKELNINYHTGILIDLINKGEE